jgi:hypothetical protein
MGPAQSVQSREFSQAWRIFAKLGSGKHLVVFRTAATFPFCKSMQKAFICIGLQVFASKFALALHRGGHLGPNEK